MYINYLLPSKRFLLTVHTLTPTHLKLLDTLTDKFIKKWSGIPPSATNAIIHMDQGLGVKSISEMYTECHAVSHTRTMLKGDQTVNTAINATLEREGGGYCPITLQTRGFVFKYHYIIKKLQNNDQKSF